MLRLAFSVGVFDGVAEAAPVAVYEFGDEVAVGVSEAVGLAVAEGIVVGRRVLDGLAVGADV
jgi:hypothetical protein